MAPVTSRCHWSTPRRAPRGMCGRVVAGVPAAMARGGRRGPPTARRVLRRAGGPPGEGEEAVALTKKERLLMRKGEGPSTDLSVIANRFWKVASPYWTDPESAPEARKRLLVVGALTLSTTGVRDFFNYLSNKDVENFTLQLYKYLGAFAVGIPLFVLKDYYLSKLGLQWRQWMTARYLNSYMEGRSFYKVQADGLVDNPDQRISSDVQQFTSGSLDLVFTLIRSAVDLISFSGILLGIYPPLFVALLLYAGGGTAVSFYLGKPLVGLNFNQEAREADFRYGMVRVRENAESIAFYGGEAKEEQLLLARLKEAVKNYGSLLITSRNLEFFTSFYQYAIAIVPAAVVAPLYFRGEVEFGIINQSSSAFRHVLDDVSLIVFQFQSLAGFSAIIDRLGEFAEALDACKEEADNVSLSGTVDEDDFSSPSYGYISLQDVSSASVSRGENLLDLRDVTLRTPNGKTPLVNGLSCQVRAGESMLIMGPSGVGKTSILRAVAGLWFSGSGAITRYIAEDSPGEGGASVAAFPTPHDIFFMPQRPYMVLGTLRDQLLYPTWASASPSHDKARDNGSEPTPVLSALPEPSDAELEAVLETVRLSQVVTRLRGATYGEGKGILDAVANWGSELSLGEQQRLAFARVLLTKPKFLLMDESTSALDQDNQDRLYQILADQGVTYVSVGHRPSLVSHHAKVLRLSLPAEPDAINWEVLPAADLLAARKA